MPPAKMDTHCQEHRRYIWGCHPCGAISGIGPGSPKYDREAARRRPVAEAIANLWALTDGKPQAGFFDAVLQLGGAFFASRDATGKDVSNTGTHVEPDYDKAWKAASQACVVVVDGEHTYQPPQSPEQWKRALQAAYESGAFGAPARTA